jgi:thiol-disulfide isomerase/thioredoxin
MGAVRADILKSVNTRTLLTVGTLLAVVGAGGVLLQKRTPSASASGVPSIESEAFSVRLFKNREPVKDFSVQTLDGRRLTAADLRGKVTVINFWATWCPPCKAEIPDLIALQERYRDHLVIIGVSEDEGPVAEVQRFAAEHRINYPIVMTTEELRQAFPGVTALPTTFVLDRDVRLAQKHVGLLNPATTEHEMLALAGLAANASIESVDPEQPVGLVNAAQAKEIPGIDLKGLSGEKRVATLMRLNAEACTCGCGLTVAKCRIDDPACGVSLPIARRIAAEIAAAPKGTP